MSELVHLWSLKILVALFLFSLASFVYSGSNHSESSFQFRPGVIVDSEENPTIYLMSPRGSVEAVELRSGKRRWDSSEAVRPLLLDRNYLIAQAEPFESPNTLRLAVLDAKEGKKLFHTDVKLPQGVQALVDNGPGTSFHLTACQHNGKVYISWGYKVLYMGGVAPDPTVNPNQLTTGYVYLDLHTKQAGEIMNDQVPCQIAPQMPDPAVKLIKTNKITGRTWLSGNILATTSRTRGNEINRTVLERWDLETGKELPSITLFEGKLNVRYPSMDNRHLLASGSVQGADVLAKDRYLWKIFSLQTGDLTADFRSEIVAARFFLSNSYLIHDVQAKEQIVDGKAVLVEPLGLRAIDLRTGSETWSRPLRDTRYKGTAPPLLGEGQ